MGLLTKGTLANHVFFLQETFMVLCRLPWAPPYESHPQESFRYLKKGQPWKEAALWGCTPPSHPTVLHWWCWAFQGPIFFSITSTKFWISEQHVNLLMSQVGIRFLNAVLPFWSSFPQDKACLHSLLHPLAPRWGGEGPELYSHRVVPCSPPFIWRLCSSLTSTEKYSRSQKGGNPVEMTWCAATTAFITTSPNSPNKLATSSWADTSLSSLHGRTLCFMIPAQGSDPGKNGRWRSALWTS